MSIIQTIRDRAAILVFGIIAISLIGFLVQDAFVGKTSSLFRGSTSTVGSINGTNVKREDYDERIKNVEAQYQSQGYTVNETMRQTIYEQIWSGYVNKTLLEDEADKLGLTFTPKELGELLFSDRAPQQFKQEFTDQQTGIYNIEAAKNAFRNLQRSKNTAQVKQINEQILDPITLGEINKKFEAIFTGGVYFPKWLIEKQNSENSLVSNISYVANMYSTISDSTVKVTDAEIEDYVQKRKDQFKQAHSKSIAYVAFSAAPNAQDSAALWKKLENLKTEFKETNNAVSFLTKNGTKTPFFDSYVGKTRIQQPIKDTLLKLSIGEVYGPYLDANSYALAKMIDIKSLPDSIKARHILIATRNPQTGQELLDDSTAKKRIDSIALAIKNGAPFDSLALKFSDDKVSALKGGDLGYFGQGQMVKSFNDFAVEKAKGEKGVVKTEYGYHYIEIQDQKNFEPAYKIAYLAKQIEASDETDKAALAAATQFSANSRDQKSFDQNVGGGKLNKKYADNLPEMAFDIPGLGSSRQLVKWAYDNKTGTVSDPFSIGDQYVVAIVTGEKKEGTQDAATARLNVEHILRDQKKAEKISEKFGKYNTLDELAGKLGTPVTNVDSLRWIGNAGNAFVAEPLVIGAAMNKNYQGKVSPALQGTNGVYAIKVNNIGAVAIGAGTVEEQAKFAVNNLRRTFGGSLLGALKDDAKIKDKRAAVGY